MSAFMLPRTSPAVESMLASGQLSRVSADLGLAEAILERARGRLRSASRALADDDLSECASPLWDAVRLGCTAILQSEGLRTHGEGHHAAVLEAITEQYGHILGVGLRPARRLREARRDSQYPVSAVSEPLDADELAEDLDTVRQLIDAVAGLIPNVPVYRA
jgi:hypothetical protein